MFRTKKDKYFIIVCYVLSMYLQKEEITRLRHYNEDIISIEILSAIKVTSSWNAI
ncbi:hypothetical protein CPJCM30710_11130 [Clostridium polyendosporum]|uniref:Uncharacterized protein n=1 Tax=Clostridium polyendosporum TaxID=69208 RepID=A0A919RY65_9CLOT|nr:hypothetical protein CPJCM30710_11130 [Clostridium polyendosporum]